MYAGVNIMRSFIYCCCSVVYLCPVASTIAAEPDPVRIVHVAFENCGNDFSKVFGYPVYIYDSRPDRTPMRRGWGYWPANTTWSQYTTDETWNWFYHKMGTPVDREYTVRFGDEGFRFNIFDYLQEPDYYIFEMSNWQIGNTCSYGPGTTYPGSVLYGGNFKYYEQGSWGDPDEANRSYTFGIKSVPSAMVSGKLVLVNKVQLRRTQTIVINCIYDPEFQEPEDVTPADPPPPGTTVVVDGKEYKTVDDEGTLQDVNNPVNVIPADSPDNPITNNNYYNTTNNTTNTTENTNFFEEWNNVYNEFFEGSNETEAINNLGNALGNMLSNMAQQQVSQNNALGAALTGALNNLNANTQANLNGLNQTLQTAIDAIRNSGGGGGGGTISTAGIESRLDQIKEGISPTTYDGPSDAPDNPDFQNLFEQPSAANFIEVRLADLLISDRGFLITVALPVTGNVVFSSDNIPSAVSDSINTARSLMSYILYLFATFIIIRNHAKHTA